MLYGPNKDLSSSSGDASSRVRENISEDELKVSAKQKLTKDYFEEEARRAIDSIVVRKRQIKKSRNYYASKRDMLDFEFLEDIYGMQNPIDLGFTNIIKPRVDALVGLSLMSDPLYSVQYTDVETMLIDDRIKAEGLKKDLLKSLVKDSKALLEKHQADEKAGNVKNKNAVSPEEKTKTLFETLYKKYTEDFQSGYLIAAQHIIQLIETDSEIDLSNVKKEFCKDYFITGEAYIKECYIGEGKDPKIEIRLPEEIYDNRPKRDKDYRRTNVVVSRRRVSTHQVLKEIGHILTKEEAALISELYIHYDDDDYRYYRNVTTSEGMDSGFDSYKDEDYFDNYVEDGFRSNDVIENFNTIDFYHVEWLASSEIPDGNGGHIFREDRYECYRINNDLYVGGRRCDEAPRNKDKPWQTKLSYKAAINATRTGHVQSMVNDMRELQDLYDIIMFFRNNAVAHSGVSGSRVNVAAIPKNLGKKFMDRLTKWITLRKQGVELIDPTEEGANLFQHYGEFSAAIDGKTIESFNAILESLMVQADIVSGVPRQMLGVIQQRDAVQNVKVGIEQVSVLSLEYFRDIDRAMSRAVQGTLDNFKYAYRNKARIGIIKNGAAMVPMLAAPEGFSATDFKVSVVSAGIEQAKLLNVQTLAKEFASQGLVDPDVLVAVVNKRSTIEVEEILKKAVAKRKEENDTINQLQQQLEESGKQVQQMEAEINRLKNNAAKLDKERLQVQREANASTSRLKEKELNIKDKTADSKINNDAQELVLKKGMVELEKEQLLSGTGREREVNKKAI